jgi:hypothetical protein
LIAVRSGHNRRLTICAGLLMVGMAGFCFLLRWQPWHSRYQLPFFVCFMPVVAATLPHRWPRWALDTAGAVVVGFAVLVIACNETRPISNPSYLAQSWTGKMLFKYGPVFQERLATLAGDIINSGCKDIGLKFNADDAEYPLWALLREHRFIGKIENAYVESEAARLAPEGTNFCVLITMTGRALPAEAGQRFPYRVEYEQTTAYWSEQASHWRDLTWFDTESQVVQSVSANSSVIPFRHRLIPFYFRSPRPGNLRLTATAVFNQQTLIVKNLLRTTIGAKVQESVPLRDGRMALDLRVPAGESRLSLGLAEPLETDSTAARLVNFQWSFEALAL